MIGLDTSAVIDLFKKDASLIKLLEKINDSNDKVALNQITYLELMFGLNFEDESSKREEEYYDSLFGSSIVIQLNNSSSKKAAKISLQLKKIGKTIEQSDCTIAAVFITNGINKILTRNKKHFENIKELEIVEY